MLTNRSMPRCTVIPELAYADVTEASDWLCGVFGFTVRLRIGNHRAQLNIGDGAMVVTEHRGGEGDSPVQRGLKPPLSEPKPPLSERHAVMVRVDDVHAHHERAAQRGARILRPPADYPYGERQYTAEDPGGHCWTFSQSIADVAPEDWGGAAE